jgi:GAF domain-containing protein
LTDSASRAADLGQILEEALDALEQTLRPDRASVLLFDPDGVMRFKAWRALSDGYRKAVEGHSPWKADAVDPVPVLIPDVRDAPDLAVYGDLFEREGIAALAFIPLVSGGRLLGKFMLY